MLKNPQMMAEYMGNASASPVKTGKKNSVDKTTPEINSKKHDSGEKKIYIEEFEKKQVQMEKEKENLKKQAENERERAESLKEEMMKKLESMQKELIKGGDALQQKEKEKENEK